MAENKPRSEQEVAPKSPASGVNAVDDQTFPVADLIARSIEYLGVPGYVTAGALYAVADDLTIDAAQSRINTWLETPEEV